MSITPLGKLDGFAIKALELTRQFGNLTALDHIEMSIPYGEIFGLLGANGAGKSTVNKIRNSNAFG